MKLWQKVTLGLILGILFGVYFPNYVNYIKPIGTVFLRLIKMIITPLIFFSLVAGITSMNSNESLGRIGTKAVVAFLTTTCFATAFGLLVALILKPGEGAELNLGYQLKETHVEGFNFVEFFISFIPENIIGSFLHNNTLQIVFLALFSSIIINKMGSTAAPLKEVINIISRVVLKMIGYIVQLSPYAAFALTGWVIGTEGVGILFNLYHLVIATIIAMICQYFIFGILILVFCRMSPIPFYRKSLEYQVIAFSTSSSKATLPTTMQVCREKLGISETSTSFVLPLGASINMDGFAIKLSLTTIFFAQALNIDLQFYDYIVIILTATIGSIGGAGIPGASLIMLPMVLSSVNIPIEGVAMIAGIDRILDMLSTTINITGDTTITLMVDASENKLDKDKYFS